MTMTRQPCSECGGMGVKTFDIIVNGTEHDTEDVPCERCKDTEGFEPDARAHLDAVYAVDPADRAQHFTPTRDCNVLSPHDLAPRADTRPEPPDA
jgi:hypothetical protein